MFESSLMELGPHRRPVRRWLSLPVAVALHLVVLASVCFAQYWQVDRIAEPDQNVVFVTAAPLPALPAEPGPRPAGPRPATPPAPAPPAPQPRGAVQPTVVPDVIPPVPSAPEPPFPGIGDVNSTSTSTTGVPGMEGLGEGDGTPGNGTGDGPGGGGDGDTGDIVYRPGNGVSRPQLVFRIDPRYTEQARRAHLQGTVILEATIDETGQVTSVSVIKPLPLGLDRSAVEAVQQWRFKPAVYEGRKVKVKFSLTVNFVVS